MKLVFSDHLALCVSVSLKLRTTVHIALLGDGTVHYTGETCSSEERVRSNQT
jgi:hypothetical protein